MTVRPIFAALIASTMMWVPAIADPVAPESHKRQAAAREYSTCMKMARSNPSRGHKIAKRWVERGGGAAAEHCVAVAVLGLGNHSDAARRLERLADKSERREMRVDLLGQAGNAWLIAGDTKNALAAQSAALKLDPDNVELMVDRSITLASAGRYWDAVDDLNRVLDKDPDRTDALILRASAYRRLDSLALAEDDISRALEHAPHHPDALLERGIVRHLGGDNAGARSDWRRVIEVAPRSGAAQAARKNIKAIE